MSVRWWFSSKRMIVFVETYRGRVVDTAPIAKKFVGQPVKNLVLWMKRQGDFQRKRIGLHLKKGLK